MHEKKRSTIGIERSISLSIKEGRWLLISFDSRKEKRITSFWCYVADIDPDRKILYCDIYNDYKGSDTLEKVPLPFERILSAQVLNFTTGGINKSLIRKINADLPSFSWLKYENYDNNILRYLELCAQGDSDPYVKRAAMLTGLDAEVLEKKGIYHLSEEQMHELSAVVKEEEIEEWDDRHNELALSRLSIDIGEKKYVLAYQNVAFSPKSMTLELDGHIRLNPSFLIDGKKHSLSSYTELSSYEFLNLLKDDFLQASSLIRESLRYKETLNSRPEFYCLCREYLVDYASLFEEIERRWASSSLEAPLRAFFGNSSYADNGRRKPGIVLFDSSVNADQAFAIYSALKNKVTYVQGPPGTGKTCTIFNVILSCFFNTRTVLVSTSNNKPLDGIAKKLSFIYKGKEIPLPYLRLGNRQVNEQALAKLASLFKGDYSKRFTIDKLDRLCKKVLEKNRYAVDSLTNFQERKALEENLSFLDKVMAMPLKKKVVDKERERIEKRLGAIPKTKEEDIISAFVSLSKDEEALEFLYQSSIARLARLSSSHYDKLRNIALNEQGDRQVSSFNAFLRDDGNMKLLTEVFPIIFSTNLSSEKLGSLSFLFDLVIMDEAGQADIAKSLLPISRGKSLLLVGDEDQLLPVTGLDPSINEDMRNKLKVSETYDYLSNSILSTMKKADKVSNRILLRSHYRCGKKIIAFNNEYFYHKQLRLSSSLEEGEVYFSSSQSQVKPPLRNQNFEEAKKVVAYIKKHPDPDTAIITPFVNQASLINALLEKDGIKGIKASTIHSVQGDEKKTIVISSGISRYSNKKTIAWLNGHGEIANVAVSRAKKKLVVFGDEESLKRMSTGDSVWNTLFSYCKAKGELEVVSPIYQNAEVGLSHGSISEEEFYHTIAQIVSIRGKLSIVRNVMLKDVLGEEYSSSKQEFDAVIYSKGVLQEPKAKYAFEFDGGEHYKDIKRIQADKQKEKACRAKGLKLLRIPNSYSKDYEFLKTLIEDYAKDIDAPEQLSLF